MNSRVHPETQRELVEAEVRTAWAAGEMDRAATLLLEGYGPELHGYLIARMNDETLAADAFAELAVDLWRGLASFEWRSSVRSWAYAVARHAAARVVRAPHRRPERNLALSGDVPPSRLMADIRSRTATYLRTETKSRFRELRGRLDEADQSMLILRVDRGMSWREVAVAMSDPSASDDAVLLNEAARLRKRYQLVKERLRAMAVAEGLIADEA